MDYTLQDIAGMIDHSLLHPTLTHRDLEDGCGVARHWQVASVCIMPYALPLAVELLQGSAVLPTTTVGFPHGCQLTPLKMAEARQALSGGARELDMVVNVSQVLSGAWSYVEDELRQVIDLAHGEGAKVKVIFENCFLKEEHKVRLCRICGDLGADWVKTSTGFGTGGATLEDLKLMRRHSPPQVQVKAAGGVRDLDQLLAVRALGVTRVGATRTVDILTECRRRLEGPG